MALRTVGQALERRRNNFNLCRMAGALFIVFGHAMLIAGVDRYYNTRDPFLVSVLVFVGNAVLRLFFVFSGFMVAMSLDRRNSLCAYAAARMMRILPPLLLVSAVLAFIVGPLVTSLPTAAYFTRGETWAYLPLAGSGLFVPDLPGVFEAVPRPTRIDPPLWTLLYEIICYVALAILAAIGGLSRTRLPWVLLVAAVAYLGIALATDLRQIEFYDAMTGFGSSFLIGVAIYHYRSHIPLALWPVALLGALTVLSRGTPWIEPASTLALATLGLWVALVPKGRILAYNRVGELSYALYIWHWPVGQVLVSLWPGLSGSALFTLMVLITVPITLLSWMIVELPALRRVPAVANWFARATARLPRPAYWRSRTRLLPPGARGAAT